MFFSVTFAFYVGSCWILRSVLIDIKNDLPSLDETSSGRNRLQAKVRVSEIADLHSEAKQLVNLFYCGICSFRFASGINNSFDYTVAGVFTWTVLTICSSLLVMQAELVEYKHLNALFISDFELLFFDFHH